MEEADELRAEAMAPEPSDANPNQELTNNPSKAREEGELSSDDSSDADADDDDENICPTSQSTSTSAPPVESVPVPLVNKCTQDFQADKVGSETNHANSLDIQSRPFSKSIAQKCIDKKQTQPKTATPGWCAGAGATNNLVISFSDDESGSGSEECKEKDLGTKGNTTRLGGVRKPPISSCAKLNKQTATTVNKVMPKKLSLNRTFVASTAKTQGTNFRGAGLSSAEQGYRVGRFNALNKNLKKRDQGYEKGVGLNNNKLQDLRQQIALRESELRLKSAQRSKELASCRDDNAMSIHNDATRKYGAIYTQSVQIEPREPEKKRAKVSESYLKRPNSAGPQETFTAKSGLPSKEPVMDNNNLQDAIKGDHGWKGISVGRTESSVGKWKKHNDEHVGCITENISVGAKDGVNGFTNCARSENSKQMDIPVTLNQVMSLANVTSNVFTENLNTVELSHPSNINMRQEPSTSLNKSVPGKSLMRGNNHDVLSNDKILKSTFNNIYQASLNNESLGNCLANESVSGLSNMNARSLVETEEALDKDLDEAQEHRRRCEIEERNALKAYRKAQMALVEANARCSDLYRKRELYSAHLRSFIMDNSSLFCLSRQNEQGGNGLDYSENEVIPTSNHHLRPEYHGSNPLGLDSNIQCLSTAPVHMSYRQENGQNLCSEPCSEPDGSTSEPLPHRGKTAADGVFSPSNDPNISADEDEGTFSFENVPVQPNFECHKKNCEEERKDLNKESSGKLLIDSSQDSFLLEATLRSQLFARLGTKNFPRTTSSCDNMEPAVERGAENDLRTVINRTRTGCSPFSEREKNQHSDYEGTDRQERRNSEAQVEMQNDCCTVNSLNSHSNVNSEDNRYSNREGHSSLLSEAFSPHNILRSTFHHMKIISPASLIELQARNRQSHISDIDKGGAGLNSDKIQCSNSKADSIHETFGELCGREIGSYTSNVAVDSFWPLCMYELRGKCNNDECPWQHVKDYSNSIVYQNEHEDFDSAANQKIGNATRRIPKNHDVMTSPMYLVGFDILKDDLHLYDYVLERRNGQCLQKCFSLSLVLSNLFQKDLPADGLFSDDGGGRTEVDGIWNRQLSYLLSRNGRMNEVKQGLDDNGRALEMAILTFNQEANKLERMKKALPVLSRALEAEPMSVILWILYLLLFYSNMKSLGKDDMFSYAVQYNKGSYELWLMYINSRMQLDHRLVAYEAALSALCHHSSDSKLDQSHASACILDIFLQMMECLCMSGNFGKAIQKIAGHSFADTNSDESPLLLSDLLPCLTLSDKCIFWICCVYLVVYRKLPDALVQQFECEKQLIEIEWPSIHLIDDEMRRVVKVLETGAYSVDAHMKTESLKSDNLRSAHFFAVNHIMCVAALGKSEWFRNLLDKYLVSYPSCLELVLISARAQKQECGEVSFIGFEETLSNWPKDVPGIQCIWNQYAEYVLQNGNFDIGKKIMDRWFNSAWNFGHHENGIFNDMDSCNMDRLQASAPGLYLDNPSSNPNQVDVMFGYLNLSLFKLFQNDHIEARLAVDKALKAAFPKYLKFCMREHSLFLLTDESLSRESVPISYVLNILKLYVVDPVPDPLPRKFINNIKKPRVRQLVSNIFSPVSSDCSLVNSVLEVWYGPSLFPDNFSEPKCLVDFVESILDVYPSNYELAISVCKLLSSCAKGSDVSSASILFWASLNLVSAIFHCIPIPPEYVWVEAADILGKIMGTEVISERFYKRALLVYPFSVKLWKSYYIFSMTTDNTNTVVEAAKEKGIDLS
ncbi:hypothetical protein FNV43_RR24847 [Rhamnella rubrinervis]|uniref:Putative zinc-finger domain-containing protein n=1 Tax=Rhamnella rubrinervis TaxID=2594499 RepID=A0A8K0DTD1_9ROSA|nr:hypothetical protein FNV43_RR24847 [Rhamnella rubrinervis]